jgi:membrane-associated protease RseP (regulator of RpoE activity)
VFGWKRGSTLYQVALVPIGGYVRMAGEESAESRASPARDELHGKTVGQRFLIYSGGVLANVAFGLVVFPIIFAVGVRARSPSSVRPRRAGRRGTRTCRAARACSRRTDTASSSSRTS